ncbi:MAG: pilus assembly protein TadG-related protein, partial [Thermomicrobiales bacterium]
MEQRHLLDRHWPLRVSKRWRGARNSSSVGNRKRTANDEGQALVLFALFSFVLVGALALALDVGYLLTERRETQAAADASALAAAKVIADGASFGSASVTDAATTYAVSNGMSNDANVTVTPTWTGPEPEDGTVQVSITQPVQRFFLGAVYTGDWQVNASAIAEIDSRPESPALVVEGDLILDGSPTVDVIGGSLWVGGTIDVISSGRVWADDDIIAGGFETVPGQEWRINSRDGEKKIGTTPIEDPLAGVIVEPTLPTFPSVGGVFGSSPAAKTCADGVTYNASTRTLTVAPGTYSDASMREGGNCFASKAGSDWNNNTVKLEFTGGDYLFTGGAGIYVDTNRRVNITLDEGTYYFTGGGGFVVYGPNEIDMLAGYYYFDGGDGMYHSISNNNRRLEFHPGEYEFWFNGTDFVSDNNAQMESDGLTHAKWYFYDGNMDIIGNGLRTTEFPSGNYFFENGHLLLGLHTDGRGDDTFFYFTGEDSWVRLAQCAQFQFSAPNYAPYPGGTPGMLILGGVGNTSEFINTGSQWSGNSEGLIYTPDATWTIGLEWGETYTF